MVVWAVSQLQLSAGINAGRAAELSQVSSKPSRRYQEVTYGRGGGEGMPTSVPDHARVRNKPASRKYSAVTTLRPLNHC